MNKRQLRSLGRALIAGTRDELIAALDEAIEPKGLMWERISDIIIGWVAAPIEGRAEVIQGIRPLTNWRGDAVALPARSLAQDASPQVSAHPDMWGVGVEVWQGCCLPCLRSW